VNIFKMLGALITVVLTFGCGGGGSTQSGTPKLIPTSIGTAVSMVPFKSLYKGTTASGTITQFDLTGSDNYGNPYTGSLQIQSYGATTFDGQNVTGSQVTMSFLELPATTPGTIGLTRINISGDYVSNRYFLKSNGYLYKTTESIDITGVPNSQPMFPDTINVGDSGYLYVISYSDGTIDTAKWNLIADTNGRSILNITITNTDQANTIQNIETDNYYLDASGNIFKYSTILNIDNYIITLSGPMI